jgi:hypothetical protein
MAIAMRPIIARKTMIRPARSDIQPENVRPIALPQAPITRVIAESAPPAMPTLLAKGTTWLMTISPAEVPSAYAIHMR